MSDTRQALHSLRREMELRWTGQFIENAVCTIDAATARIQALETSLAEAEGRVIAEVVAWLRM